MECPLRRDYPFNVRLASPWVEKTERKRQGRQYSLTSGLPFFSVRDVSTRPEATYHCEEYIGVHRIT